MPPHGVYYALCNLASPWNGYGQVHEKQVHPAISVHGTIRGCLGARRRIGSDDHRN